MSKKFKDEFINKYIQENNLTIIDSDENKPWGGYYIYEANDDLDKKILMAYPNEFLSLQYHGDENHVGHNEEWTALTKIRIVLGNKSVVRLSKQEFDEELKNLRIITLKPGEKIEIPAGYLHALVNPFLNNIYVLETRMSQIKEAYSDREANIVRVYDQNKRSGAVEWPEELIERIKE